MDVVESGRRQTVVGGPPLRCLSIEAKSPAGGMENSRTRSSSFLSRSSFFDNRVLVFFKPLVFFD
jgi:hypothetical protein